MTKFNKIIIIKVTEEQKKILEGYAYEQDMSLSAYIRWKLIGEKRKEEKNM